MPPPVASGRYSWVVVLLRWTVCFFSYADRQAFYSVFPLLQKEMALTSVQLGLLGSDHPDGKAAFVLREGAPQDWYWIENLIFREELRRGESNS